jgi:hypothetical protein
MSMSWSSPRNKKASIRWSSGGKPAKPNP